MHWKKSPAPTSSLRCVASARGEKNGLTYPAHVAVRELKRWSWLCVKRCSRYTVCCLRLHEPCLYRRQTSQLGNVKLYKQTVHGKHQEMCRLCATQGCMKHASTEVRQDTWERQAVQENNVWKNVKAYANCMVINLRVRQDGKLHAGRRNRHRRISSLDEKLERRSMLEPGVMSPASSGDLTVSRAKVCTPRYCPKLAALTQNTVIHHCPHCCLACSSLWRMLLKSRV